MPPTEDHEKPTYTVSPDVRERFDKLLAEPLVRKGFIAKIRWCLR